MSIKTLAFFFLAFACAGAGHAQLSSPVPGVSPKPAASAAPALGNMDGVGKPGSGLGAHGANSPFAPLKPRDDVVPWAVLADIKIKTDKNKIVPVFNTSQLALRQKTQRIQGFMMPLEPGEKQRHFILSSVPLTCGFCLPGGPESLVEVKTKEPVKYSMEAVVVQGRFEVLTDDPYGVYYRVTDAVAVK
jgi:uncharacterized protein